MANNSNNKWDNKAKQVLGCLQTQTLGDDDEEDAAETVCKCRVSGEADSLSSSPPRTLTHSSPKPKMCAICEQPAIAGLNHAIFIAECSHAFHFDCVASNNVKHGNRVCPVCRAKWKEIPLQSQTLAPCENLSGNVVPCYRNYLQLVHPAVYDDDDPIEPQNSASSSEVTPISMSVTLHDSTVLINLKAPVGGSQNSRAPVDLVTVLDVSGSMTGTKLALLKQAMRFMIHHLGPGDRLSIIAYSSMSSRLFPLRRMNDTGKQQALQAVNSLSSNGGTNIAEGLKKGIKVILDRRSRNPVSSIILLSDGQDTCTVTGSPDYKSLFPSSIQHIPVHTFGLGPDHDALSMYSIAECSGGTFSFINVAPVIKNAFARCMGGLLSVVAQEVTVVIQCMHSRLALKSIQSGSYHAHLANNSREGVINVGELYAEEERDFLVTVNSIHNTDNNETPLLQVNCTYYNPLINNTVTLDGVQVQTDRPYVMTGPVVRSNEVDIQHNRLGAVEAMSRAQSVAEDGYVSRAREILQQSRGLISQSESAEAPLSVTQADELRELVGRMYSRKLYEDTGRAYLLSGLSSHSRQRATSRGDPTSRRFSRIYQTTMMAEMEKVSLFEEPNPR